MGRPERYKVTWRVFSNLPSTGVLGKVLSTTLLLHLTIPDLFA